MPTIAERVSAGARLLDKKCHRWEDRIDVSVLAVQSPDNCPLGQLYGDFFYGTKEVLDYWHSCYDLGFMWRAAGSMEHQRTEIVGLDAAWVEEVINRRMDAADKE